MPAIPSARTSPSRASRSMCTPVRRRPTANSSNLPSEIPSTESAPGRTDPALPCSWTRLRPAHSGGARQSPCSRREVRQFILQVTLESSHLPPLRSCIAYAVIQEGTLWNRRAISRELSRKSSLLQVRKNGARSACTEGNQREERKDMGIIPRQGQVPYLRHPDRRGGP